MTLTLSVAAGLNAAPRGAAEVNPLFAPSPLPYELPPFALIKEEHFAPALERGMDEERQEVAAILAQAGPPTFENTIIALERRGETLARARRAFTIYTSGLTTPALQQIEAAMAPRLAAHADAIMLDAALFARVQALHERRESLGLDPESQRLLERYHQDFVRAGARLADADKDRLRALNAELASLSTRFSQNVLKEINASAVLFDRREELAGWSDAALTAAGQAAKAAGHEGRYPVRLTNTSGQPPLASLTVPATREKIMQASLARGSRGGEFDNRALVARLARLRAERAVLLGYAHHAEFQLEDQTVGGVAALNQLLAQAAPLAAANARAEAAALQAAMPAGEVLTAADWAFYAEKVRQERYAFDAGELRPYFELTRVLEDGVFYAATRLFGLTFQRRPDLQGYTADMVVYEVFEADGSPLGLFLGDFYARPSKRGGAWASAYVPQNGLTGRKPVIGNHLNVPKPPAGQPTLLTYDEVETLFHEFGHALHGLFSAVKYPRFAGTAVPRDFVEFPSQVNELWATWPEVLANYARHHQTGEPIPAALVARIEAAEKFNQGFKTSEYLAATLLDQAWHQLAPGQVPEAEDVLAFEAAALGRAGLDFAPVPPRYRSTYFSHVFSGGYSAGYYAYFWSEVLDAQVVRWIETHGGLTRGNGERLRAALLSRGGSAEALDLFRELTGEEPDIRPLFERRGLGASAAGE